jgi:hypothetical protein
MSVYAGTGIDEILKEAAGIWPDSVLSEQEKQARQTIRRSAGEACKDRNAKYYADACECFYLFRVIHRMSDADPGWAALTGDYFFSRFSHALIPIDSVPLTDRFSDYLLADTVRHSQPFDLEDYLMFIRRTAEEIAL